MDRGIRDTVAAEPSPEFAARVLRRVQQERASAQSWSAGWFPAMAGALAVLVLSAVWLVRHELPHSTTSPSARNAPIEQRSRAAETTQAAISQAEPVRPATHVRGRESVRPATAEANQPEVLVPRGEEAAVLRLYAAVWSGRVDVASLVAESPPLKPAEIRVAPLAVTPLGAATKAGERDANR